MGKMDNTKTVSDCTAGNMLSAMAVQDGEGVVWKPLQVTATDRYYIVFRDGDGLDYLMADAVVLMGTLDPVADGEPKVKAVGINYGVTSCVDTYWLDNTFGKELCDTLDSEALKELLESRTRCGKLTREQALREIKRDFLASKVRLTAEVMEAFDQVK